MTSEQMRSLYSEGVLTWGDLLEITGLSPYDLFAVLEDLIA